MKLKSFPQGGGLGMILLFLFPAICQEQVIAFSPSSASVLVPTTSSPLLFKRATSSSSNRGGSAGAGVGVGWPFTITTGSFTARSSVVVVNGMTNSYNNNKNNNNNPPSTFLQPPSPQQQQQQQQQIQQSRSKFLSSSLLSIASTLAIVSTSTTTATIIKPQKADAYPVELPGTATTAATATATSSINLAAASSASDTNSTSSKTTESSISSLEESISGFIAGASLATTKTIVKYPLDTATVRLQIPNSQYSIYRPLQLLDGSFRGITTPLVSNIPAGAVFFAVKDATKEYLKSSSSSETSSSSSSLLPSPLPKWASTSLAVLAATFPYMLVRNPSEVIKTRQQAGLDGYGEGVTAMEAFQKVKQGGKGERIRNNKTETSSSSSSWQNFYVGYWENCAYTYPADVIKFVSYEQLSGGRKNLPPLEGAVYGAMATAIAQCITTPLDVVRNRIMVQAGKEKDDEEDDDNNEDDDDGSTTTSSSSLSYLETLTRIGKEEGLQGLFAGVSPRVAKAMLSGAIQFATYEETKQSLANFFQKRR